MAEKISFDMFSKNKKNTQTQNERDADEIKVTGAIITTDKKLGTKTKKNVTQTDTWGEGADIKALEGATMEDKPMPKTGKSGRFTNSKNKRINWNSKLETSKPATKPPTQIGTWGEETKPKNQWNTPAKFTSREYSLGVFDVLGLLGVYTFGVS